MSLYSPVLFCSWELSQCFSLKDTWRHCSTLCFSQKNVTSKKWWGYLWTPASRTSLPCRWLYHLLSSRNRSRWHSRSLCGLKAQEDCSHYKSKERERKHDPVIEWFNFNNFLIHCSSCCWRHAITSNVQILVTAEKRVKGLKGRAGQTGSRLRGEAAS